MTSELTYGALWLIAAAYFAVHTIWRRGGVMSAASMVVMFVILAFTSTNVLASTSGDPTASLSNPMVGWLAVFLAICSTLILLFTLFGWWARDDDQGADDRPSVTEKLTGRL